VRKVTADGVDWATGPARHEGGTRRRSAPSRSPASIQALPAAALAAEHGIGVRDGAFCLHPLMDHLGSRHAVRASIGVGTSAGDIDRLLYAVEHIARNGTIWSYVARGGSVVPDPTRVPARRSAACSAARLMAGSRPVADDVAQRRVIVRELVGRSSCAAHPSTSSAVRRRLAFACPRSRVARSSARASWSYRRRKPRDDHEPTAPGAG
jgi:hypothetical protein